MLRTAGPWSWMLYAVIALSGCRREPPPPATAHQDLFATDLDGQQDEDLLPWTKALAVRDFEFPRDHAAHEQYRIEWWYYTGNLISADGKKFGYQLTFFRTGTKFKPENPSRWAVRDLYTAHFAVSDLQGASHVAYQRNNRRGVGWAGAAAERYEVWNGDWRAWLDGDQHRLVAAEDGCSVDLVLTPAKPAVLHGEQGLSRKGATAGNASYYYSFTRLKTAGTLRFDGKDYEVKGTSWMDHEFSSSLLEEDQAGWDWFSIQLDDDRELMLYRMRREDGSSDRFSSGTFVDTDGSVRRLTRDDFRLQPNDHWQSPRTEATYPVSWQIEVPVLKLNLQVEATFPDQEMVTQQTTGIAYWEGAISVSGRIDDRQTSGVGYLEMTGYSGRSLGELFRTQAE